MFRFGPKNEAEREPAWKETGQASGNIQANLVGLRYFSLGVLLHYALSPIQGKECEVKKLPRHFQRFGPLLKCSDQLAFSVGAVQPDGRFRQAIENCRRCEWPPHVFARAATGFFPSLSIGLVSSLSR